ncbi:hypothetical protein [Abyssicoccus albus]|uniref:hypothetical protein n=1 Tax=Abyssicoccus albus TaxID=1817405 RepID=UPI00097E34A1|nr:hypothetical protein [Abyssicoccus albus]AQL55452.1 hypothetical protein BVH56_00080 [Abyssicoccus albus]
MNVMNVVYRYDRSVYGIKLLLGYDDLITITSKVNEQIAIILSLESMELTSEQQKKIFDVINNKKEITNDLIRKIAFK